MGSQVSGIPAWLHRGSAGGQILPWELPSPLGRFPQDSPNVLLAVGCRVERDTVPVPVPTDEPAGATLQDAEAMGRVLTP